LEIDMLEFVSSIDLGTHNRLTVPPKALTMAGFKQGESYLLYADKGTLMITRAPKQV
jgi:hypothetical protein